jgi:Skp family chaperone for outer membrane proteins
MDLQNLSSEEMIRFLEITDKRGVAVFSHLGKMSRHLEAVFETEVGKEILRYDMDRMNTLSEKMFNERADDQEKAEFRYLKKRLAFESEVLRKYGEGLDKVRKVINAGQTR